MKINLIIIAVLLVVLTAFVPIKTVQIIKATTKSKVEFY